MYKFLGCEQANKVDKGKVLERVKKEMVKRMESLTHLKNCMTRTWVVNCRVIYSKLSGNTCPASSYSHFSFSFLVFPLQFIISCVPSTSIPHVWVLCLCAVKLDFRPYCGVNDNPQTAVHLTTNSSEFYTRETGLKHLFGVNRKV